jgi:hypothetical protein
MQESDIESCVFPAIMEDAKRGHPFSLHMEF